MMEALRAPCLLICDFLEEAAALRFCYAVTECPNKVTLRNRRMYREAKDRNDNAIRQQRYREKHKSNGTVTAPLPIPISFLEESLVKDSMSAEESADVKRPPCPHEKIIELYHEILPMMARVCIVGGKSEGNFLFWHVAFFLTNAQSGVYTCFVTKERQ